MSVRLDMAARGDDASLRALQRGMPMPGAVEIAYLREPSFFGALAVEGRESTVIVARDEASGAVIGQGCLALKPAWVNGRREWIGYLSSLRIEPSYRGAILFRGYQMLRELHHGDGRARLYLTTIVEGNTAAQRLLESGRAFIPRYHNRGRFLSLALATRQRTRAETPAGVTIRAAVNADLPRLFSFWREHGRSRQFFPDYEAADLDSGLLRGLNIADILVAEADTRIAGTIALWCQRRFRQHLVTGYATSLSLFRPLYNGAARLAGYPTLPPIGTVLDFAYLALCCVAGDERTIFAALLAAALARGRGRWPFLMAGMHEHDPLLPELERYRRLAYPSRLYIVAWEDGEAALAGLDGRVPYLELGAL